MMKGMLIGLSICFMLVGTMMIYSLSTKRIKKDSIGLIRVLSIVSYLLGVLYMGFAFR